MTSTELTQVRKALRYYSARVPTPHPFTVLSDAWTEVALAEQAIDALNEIAAMPRRLQPGGEAATNPLVTGDIADKALAAL